MNIVDAGLIFAALAGLICFLRSRRVTVRDPEESEVLYWSGPFRQPGHDRVELSVHEDTVFMEYAYEERDQIARLLGTGE